MTNATCASKESPPMNHFFLTPIKRTPRVHHIGPEGYGMVDPRGTLYNPPNPSFGFHHHKAYKKQLPIAFATGSCTNSFIRQSHLLRNFLPFLMTTPL